MSEIQNFELSGGGCRASVVCPEGVWEVVGGWKNCFLKQKQRTNFRKDWELGGEGKMLVCG